MSDYLKWLGFSGLQTLGGMYADQAAANLAGAANDRANAQNAALQREFAQTGIQWKVQDAMKAGLHPTAVLGAQGYSAAPSYMSDQGGTRDFTAPLGQDITRAILASSNAQERQIHALTVERMQLENRILGQQLAGSTPGQVGPPFPGSTELVQPKPATPIVQRPDAPGQEPGTVADYGYARRGDEFYIVPSSDVKERTEDNMVQELGWLFRNQLVPTLKRGQSRRDPAPPDVPLKPGHHWEFNGVRYKMMPGAAAGIDG